MREKKPWRELGLFSFARADYPEHMHRLPISTLALLKEADMYLWAKCNSLGCGHGADLDTDALIARFGPSHSFIANGTIAKSLRCTKCGGREIEVLVRIRKAPFTKGWEG